MARDSWIMNRRDLLAFTAAAPLLTAGARASARQPESVDAQISAAAREIDQFLKPEVRNITYGGGVIRAFDIGPKDAPTVIGLHGTPSSGLSQIVPYIASGAIFCRLVTFDRPGYGGSTPQPGMKVRDTAPIIERIMDFLAVKQASVFGHSGGGPLALAAAALLGDRIVRAASLAGVGPSRGPGFDYVDGSSQPMRDEIVAARAGPLASRQFYEKMLNPQFRPLITEQIYALNDLRLRTLQQAAVEKLRTELGLAASEFPVEDAYVNDVQSWVSDWGFNFRDIKQPVRFFHGAADLMVTPRHSIWLSKQISGATVELFEHFGHNLSPLMPHVYAWLIDTKSSNPA